MVYKEGHEATEIFLIVSGEFKFTKYMQVGSDMKPMPSSLDKKASKRGNRLMSSPK